MIDKNPEKIKNMFNALASRYDFMNFAISLGIQKIIKQKSVGLIKIKKGARIADLCCGTGEIAELLARNENVDKVFALDFSPEMLQIAKTKRKSDKINFIEGDCTNLPFESSSLDGCTLGFGLRNFENYEKVVSEIARVLKNGGFFLHLDLFKGNKPVNKIFDILAVILAKIFSKSPESYKYLILSKNSFLSPEKLTCAIETQGLKCCKIRKWAFGMVSAQLFIKDCSQQG